MGSFSGVKSILDRSHAVDEDEGGEWEWECGKVGEEVGEAKTKRKREEAISEKAIVITVLTTPTTILTRHPCCASYLCRVALGLTTTAKISLHQTSPTLD